MTRSKRYRLIGPDGVMYESATKGTLGGHSKQKVYGRADRCPAATRNLSNYPTLFWQHSVWFATEADAIAAGFRPCGACLRERYAEWKRGPVPGVAFPWNRLPPVR